MKIKYIHVSDPTTEKIHDTAKSYTHPSNGPRVFDTQEEFDAFTLKLFEEDKQRGIVIAYAIIKEEQ